MKHNTSFLALCFIGLSGLFLTTGCGGSSSEDAKAQQTRDAKALEDLYSSVQGVWEGDVSNDDAVPFKGALSLYTYYVQDGANPDGSVKLRPTLRGRFQPKDFVTETDFVSLAGDYDRSGRLLLTAQSKSGASTSGDLNMLAVQGVVASGRMQVQITREGGVWGFFSGQRVKTYASAPAAGEVADARDRYLRIFGPLEGRYFGTVSSLNGSDYRVEIALVLVERPLETGGSRPALIAQYKRLDAPPGSLEWSLSVDYNTLTGEIVMRDTNSSPSPANPGGGILSLTGKVLDRSGKKVLDLVIKNKTSTLGSVKAVRADSTLP